MEVLKGAAVTAAIKEQVQGMMEGLEGQPPKLAIVRVGERPDDLSYERGAMKRMEAFGLRAQSYAFPEEINGEDFKEAFAAINRDPDVTGILLLKPLPPQIPEREIEAIIDPAKDLDGISPVNMAKVFAGEADGFAPCTAEAVVDLHDVGIQGLHVVLGVDRAGLVGADGETHHGVFDPAFLATVPGLAVYAPASFAELRTMLRRAVLEETGPAAVRYPRGGEGAYRGDAGWR